MAFWTIFIFPILAVACGVVYSDPVPKQKHCVELRSQYAVGGDDSLPLEDLAPSYEAKFDPADDIEYHLFTRLNPSVSQPLLNGNNALLTNSNYDENHRTVMLIHGRQGNAVDEFNAVLVPAIITSGEFNVIVIDWHRGSFIEEYLSSGASIASFIDWLKTLMGQTAEDFHLIGYGTGSHTAGIAGRNVEGGIGYITALQPFGLENHEDRLNRNDANYTEVIYTSWAYGVTADVNFYPNGGCCMPGCTVDTHCSQARSYFYMAESIMSGGFTGTECASWAEATSAQCTLSGRYHMGAIFPANITSGLFYVETNSAPPFSQG